MLLTVEELREKKNRAARRRYATSAEVRARRGANQKRYVKKHREYIRKRNSAVERRWRQLKAHTKYIGRVCSVSLEEFKNLVSQPCYYCAGTLPLLGSGLDRIDSKKGYETGNVRPCCVICNIAKHDMSEEEFREWAKRLYVHFVQPVTTIPKDNE